MDQNIIITKDEQETIEEKYKKYVLTGQPKLFVEMDASYEQELKYYEYTNSLDSNLRKILNLNWNISQGDYQTEIINYVNCGDQICAPGQHHIGVINTVKRPAQYRDFLDVLIYGDCYIFAQHEMLFPLKPEELHKYLCRDKIPTQWLRFMVQNESAHIKTESHIRTEHAHIRTEYVVVKSRPSFIKQFTQKCNNFLYGLFQPDYINYVLENKYNRYVDILERYQQYINANIQKQTNSVYESYIRRIYDHLKLTYTGEIAGPEMKLIRKNAASIQKLFETESCEHFALDCPENISQYTKLKLTGDYYVCEHGNKIICRHKIAFLNVRGESDLQNFMTEFTEEIVPHYKSCRICGAEIDKNPSFEKVNKYNNVNNADYSADLRKFIFGKFYRVFTEIEYKKAISDDYRNKIMSICTNMILPNISRNYDELEKQKGYTAEQMQSFKEIYVMIYAFAAVILIIDADPDLMFFKDNRKNNFDGNFKSAVGSLQKFLFRALENIKRFKTVNLDIALRLYINELKNKGKKVSLPKEYFRFREEDTVLYKCTSETCEKLKQIPVAIGDVKISGMLVEFTLFPEFCEWVKYLKECREREFGELPKIPIRWGEVQEISIPPIVNDVKYISLLYGIAFNKSPGEFHRHDFVKYTGKCSICDRVPFKHLEVGVDEKYREYLMRESRQNYFSYFCPVNFTHVYKNDICTHCGFGGPKFKHEIPARTVNITIVKNDVEMADVKQQNVKKVMPRVGARGKKPEINFWENLGCFENITFKEGLSGKSGNRAIGVFELQGYISTLIIFLNKLRNLKRHYISDLVKFTKNDVLYAECTKQLKTLHGSYEFMLYGFIDVMNKLPDDVAQYMYKLIYKFSEDMAESERHIKARSLINQKNINKFVENGVDDVDEKNDFNYDGMDYDGHNDEN